MGYFRNRQRENAETQVLPKGCEGRLGTSIETTEGVYNKYKIVTKLGCAGLEGGLVDVRIGRYVQTTNLAPNRERRRFEVDAIKESAAHIIAACTTCPLGPEGQRFESAQQMRAGSDDIDLALGAGRQQDHPETT